MSSNLPLTGKKSARVKSRPERSTVLKCRNPKLGASTQVLQVANTLNNTKRGKHIAGLKSLPQTLYAVRNSMQVDYRATCKPGIQISLLTNGK